jgi:hypothetical protein
MAVIGMSMHNDQHPANVILNKNRKPARIDPSRFEEITGKYTTGSNIYDGKLISLEDTITIPPATPMILELK